MEKSEINNLLRGFAKIFEKKKEIDDLKDIMIRKLLKNDEKIKIKEEEYIGYITLNNILMVIPKTEIIKKLIETNFEVSFDERDKEEVKGMILSMKNEIDNKKDKQKGREISSLYNSKYLNIIFNLTKNYDKSVKIKMQIDSPMFIETPDFIIILAPRIEDKTK